MPLIPNYKKTQLAEQAHRIINGGDISNDAKFSIDDVMLMVDQAVNFYVKSSLFEGWSSGEGFEPSQFIVTFNNVPVKHDKDRNQDYIELPAKYIDLPKNRGLWSIGPMKHPAQTFVPVTMNSLLFQTRSAPYLQNRVGFFAEGKYVFFTRNIKTDDGLDEVLVRLVLASADDDTINIPADLEPKIIEYVVGMLSETPPEDKSTDANATR